MEFKKPQMVIIVSFISLWIIFIGWGIVKTTLQLSKKEPLPEETPIQQPEMPRMLGERTAFKQTPTETERQPAPVLVRTFRVEPMDFSDLLPVMGTVKGETEIELRFEINGIIKSISFREGDKVNKGDLIASLDPRDSRLRLTYVENKLAAAEAAYESTLKKLEIHRKLYQAGAIIKSKLEEIELETKSAAFQLETIKTEKELTESQLEKTSLYATINGVMGPREAEEGEFVSSQDKVGSLLAIDSVLVEVGVVERDIDKIKVGQRAKLFVDAYPDVTFKGRLENIFPVVEGKSRTLTAKIKVDNPQGVLLPGMFCRAEIQIVELIGAIMIPSASLIADERGRTLVPVIPAESLTTDWQEIKTGKVHLRPVSTGYTTSDYTQITEGLDRDDLVIIEARGEIRDQTLVRVSTIEETSF